MAEGCYSCVTVTKNIGKEFCRASLVFFERTAGKIISTALKTSQKSMRKRPNQFAGRPKCDPLFPNCHNFDSSS